MLDHNEHHAEELVGVAAKLKDQGFAKAAAEIEAGVKAFKEGNAKLDVALKLVKDGIKE